MKLVFVGASKFGLRCFHSCLELANISVVGVVTAPRSFEISYRPEGVTNVLHADLAGFAEAHCIPVRTLERSMNDRELLEAVSNWQPDAFLVAGWYHMIPKSWRAIAPAYGLHASLLPDYSGGAPLVWAMINGEKKTGITLFQMDDGVDSGPIIGQVKEPIYQNDTILTLYSRIEERGIDLVKEVFPKLASGNVIPRVQDSSKRRIFPQRKPEDGLIDWTLDASTIERFIRAQTKPYPGAYTLLSKDKLYIWRATVIHNHSLDYPPGTLLFTQDNQYSVVCGKDTIVIHDFSLNSDITLLQHLPLALNSTILLG